MTKTVTVSWLMCVHEEQPYLLDAIESCLNQTFNDFELIIVINGTNANAIYEKLTNLYSDDSRIIIVTSEFSYITQNLNFGIKLASGKYIARMDSDDFSFSNRLSVQVDFLEKNKFVGLVASNIEYFSDNINVKIKSPRRYSKPESITKSLFFRNPICHPSVMIRKSVLLELGGYLGGIYAEDYDLWVRIALQKKWRLVILNEILLKYNLGFSNVSKKSRIAYANMCATQIRSFLLTGNIKWLLGAFISVIKLLILSDKE